MPKVAATFARTITCEMSLRVLNIPKAMHTCLGLGKAFPVVKGRRANRCRIHIRAFDGSCHPVTMCALPGTPHRRLSEGWRAFCAHARVSIGDTVHFHCTGVPHELDTVVVRGG
jgi:hypothetical protein